MESLRHDVKLGIRMLSKTPRFTLGAILVLAIAIGANSAIFSLVNAILLQQLPFESPERLVWVTSKRLDRADAPFTLPEYIDYRDQNRTFEELAAYGNLGLNLTGNGEPERLQANRVSGNLFVALGAKAHLGRVLQPYDDHPGNPRVVVLGYGLWKRRFGSDPNVVGRALVLNGTSHEVVGVLAREFIFPERTAEIAIPLVPDADPLRGIRSSTNFLRFIGRLRRDVSIEQAEQDVNAICDRLRRQYPKEQAQDIGVRITNLREALVGSYRRSLWLLLGAMGLVLLTAGANLANLLLTRASGRRQEMAIRQALGASRIIILRQLLTEGLLLALAGGALGLVLATQGLKLLLRFAPADLPRMAEVGIDLTVLCWTLGISALTGLFFSLAPALRASQTDAMEALKETGRGLSAGRDVLNLRNALVVFEVGLAAVLLVTGGLLLRSFGRLQHVELGFKPEGLLLARLSLPDTDYPNRDAVNVFYDKLQLRTASIPGVDSVGVISIAPMTGLLHSVPFSVEGRPPESPDKVPLALYRIISPGYMRAMGIPILQGRNFAEGDTSATRPVALVNQTLARSFFPREDVVGKQLRIDDNNSGPRAIEIVGIVGDIRQSDLDRSPTFDVYLPLAQLHPDSTRWMRSAMFCVMRTKQDPLALVASFRASLRATALNVPASSIQPMEHYLAAWMAPRRFILWLVGIFAIAGLLLAAAGIYGVISYSVALRTREIGLRMALGAQPADIVGQVVRDGAVLAFIGLVIGLSGAIALGRAIQGLLFEIRPLDGLTYLVVAGSVLTISTLACYLPARRAANVDPLVALRHQ